MHFREGVPKATPSTEEEVPDMSRRAFLTHEAYLGVMLAGALTSPLAIVAGKHARKTEATSDRILLGEETSVAEHSPDWWKKVSYKTPHEVVGKRLSTLELSYLRPAEPASLDGVPVPEVIPPIDFGGNLSRMYSAKNSILDNANPSDAQEQQETYARIQQSYGARWAENTIRSVDLQGLYEVFESESVSSMQIVHAAAERIARVYLKPAIEADDSLSSEQKMRMASWLPRYLQLLSERITPQIMLAYMATELMPSAERSPAMLEFLTKNAGLEYLASIPALGDSMLSFGPFQLTKYVIGQGKKDGDGAGSVTQMLKVAGKSEFIPASLSDFTTFEEHVRAGYLFAFYNLVALSKDAIAHRDYEGLTTILESASTGTSHGSSTVFLEQLSAAHHRPAVARAAMRNWLKANVAKNEQDRTKSLASYFPHGEDGEQVQQYADKARASYFAMKSKLRV